MEEPTTVRTSPYVVCIGCDNIEDAEKIAVGYAKRLNTVTEVQSADASRHKFSPDETRYIDVRKRIYALLREDKTRVYEEQSLWSITGGPRDIFSRALKALCDMGKAQKFRVAGTLDNVYGFRE